MICCVLRRVTNVLIYMQDFETLDSFVYEASCETFPPDEKLSFYDAGMAISYAF